MSELGLRSKSHWGYTRRFIDACREELSVTENDLLDPDQAFFVAELAGQVVGYYGCMFIEGNRAELNALFVTPEYIGRGVGRALIEHARCYLRRSGITTLLIQGDPHAAGFYGAVGGIQAGESESGSIPGRLLPEFIIYLDGDG